MLTTDDIDISERLAPLEFDITNNFRQFEPYISSIGQASKNGVPLDAQKLLEYLEDGPCITGFLPHEVRKFRKKRGNPFDYPDRPNIIRKTLAIPTRSGYVEATSYTPSGPRQRNEPALVYYHGGGFVLGDVEAYDKLVVTLAAKANILIISVNYRLAPEYPFPAPLDDVQDSFIWIHDNADALNIDRKKLAIGGDSAGANMAASTCILNRDSGRPMPALQLLLYPSTAANNSTNSRNTFSDGPLLTSKILEWFHDLYIDRDIANDPRFNILGASDHSNLPPAFVLTCGFDPLRDEGEAFAAKLKAAGCAVRHSCYTDMFHAFLNFGTLPQAGSALDECAAVLNVMKHVEPKGSGKEISTD